MPRKTPAKTVARTPRAKAAAPRRKTVVKGPVALTVTTPLQMAAEAGQNQAEQVLKATAEAAATGYQKAVAFGTENIETLARSYDDWTSYGRANSQALMDATQAATEVFEAVGTEVMALAQETMDKGVETARAVWSAKTPQDAFQLQASFAQASFGSIMAGGARMSRISMDAGQKVMAPINRQISSATEKFTRAFAM